MIEDTLRQFILDKSDIRGEWVHLDTTWQVFLDRTNYPELVRKALGEALAAVVLLSAIVKHKGSLILQIRGDGPIHLLVVQATPEGTVRGLARWNSEPASQHLSDLFGNSHMVITMEAPKTGERYQGIVELLGNSFAHALELYFAQSEQLATRIWLSSNTESCAGLLLQRLPAPSHISIQKDVEQPEEDWNRASMLFDTLTDEELLTLSAETLVFRLFHEEDPRLFDAKPIRFYCSCSLQKVQDMIKALGQEEAMSIIEEQEHIDVTCEFCNANYVLDRVDTARLFTDGVIEPIHHTIH